MADESKRVLIVEGEFAGWVVSEMTDTFNGLVGPYYYRQDATGKTEVAFKAEKRHRNGGGSVHGGCLLTLADTLARVAAAPRQLPVGALTALIGVPLFLILMRRERPITS